MQGKKEYSEKLFINFQLSERVPKDNFYRQLKDTLDLSYLPKLTAKYYGTEGQKSIDTEVFFKFMLIGYLENINSDRKIVENAKLRLDMLYFLGYDLDEPLPWHSTLSRTRQLFGEDVFLELFRNILKMCVKKGMVSGKIQSIDSAFIKANASMESLVERELNEKSKHFFKEITKNEDDKKCPKAEKHSDKFVSTTDPDARVSRKKGKFPALNHLGIISVDTENHVICGAMADFADKKDSKTTANIVSKTIENLQDNNLQIEEVLADAGYCSIETYDYLEEQEITAYIPVHGSYFPEKEGFIYNEEEDCYICSQGKKLTFRGINKINSVKKYKTKVADCRDCPLKEICCKKLKYKELNHTLNKPYYDKANKLLNTQKGKRKIKLRGATVEPVWGTLLHFRGLKKVYTKGNDLANKQVLMASAAYNLKKLMGFKTIKSVANVIKITATDLKSTIFNRISLFYEFILFCSNYKKFKLYYC